MSDAFRDAALSQLPRILGFVDREPSSPTYGCFDRNYWHYRLSDFPSAIYQDACRLLALVHHGPSAANPYAGRESLAAWAAAAAKFWAATLHRDGTADEVYPFERSFCATAFGLYAAARTWQLLGDQVPERALRSARWLARQPMPPVANQAAASANACLLVSELAGDGELRARAERQMATLLDRQTREGYFPEYGGYDLGYLSLTLSWLAQWHRATTSPLVWAAARRAAGFLESRVREDGTYDPAGTSRGTQYLYPFGLVYFGSSVRARIEQGLASGRLMQPGWFDDRYVIGITTDYWETHRLIAEGTPTCS